MKKSLTFFKSLILLLLVNQQINAQTPGYLWSTHTSGTGTERMYGGVTDPAGNVYFTGTMNDNFTWEGVPVQRFGAFFNDCFIAKYSPNGGQNWALPIGGSTGGFIIANNLHVTPDNNLVFLTRFDGQAVGDTFYIGNTQVYFQGGFAMNLIVKMDTLGNVLWTKEVSDTAHQAVATNLVLDLDTDGNIYISAVVLGGGLQLDTIYVEPFGFGYVFLAKADPNGNFIWAKSFGDKSPNGNGQGIELKVNNQKEAFISGSWSGDTVFVGNLYAVNSFIGGGFFPPSDRYICKFDQNGNAVFLATEGGRGPEDPSNIIPTANGGVASFSNVGMDTVLIDEGGTMIMPNTLLLTWYDAQGDFDTYEAWSYGPAGALYYTLIASDGMDYYQGYFFNSPTLTIGNVTLQNSAGATGTADMALLKMDAQGNIIWAMSVGGPEDEFMNGLTYSSTHGLLFSGSEANDTLVLGNDTIINAGQFTGEGFMAALNVNNIGIAENQVSKNLVVYPNPAKEVLNLDLQTVNGQQARVTIINVTGKVEMRATVNAGEVSQLNIKDLRPGLYLIEVGVGKDYAVKKFIKQ